MLSRAGFRRLVSRFDAGTLAGFVADLWSARGWETGVEGRVVLARREEPTAESRTVLVGDRIPLSLTDADVVVSLRPGRGSVAAETLGADRVGPDDLYDLYAYALEEAAREVVRESWFDDATIRWAERPRRPGVSPTGLVLVLATVLFAAAVVAGAGLAPPATDAVSPDPMTIPGEAPTATTDTARVPGVSGEYLAEPGELIGHHVRTVDGRSHVVEYVETVRIEGRVGRTNMTDRVGDGGNRSITVHRDGPIPGVAGVIDRPTERRDLFRDGVLVEAVTRRGTTEYRRLNDHDWQHRLRSLPHRGRLERHLLAGTVTLGLHDDQDGGAGTTRRLRSMAVHPGRFGAIEGVQDPEDVRVELIVEGGVIRESRVTYRGTSAGLPVRVTRTVRYTGIGTTDVERPDWYESAAGASTPVPHGHG